MTQELEYYIVENNLVPFMCKGDVLYSLKDLQVFEGLIKKFDSAPKLRKLFSLTKTLPDLTGTNKLIYTVDRNTVHCYCSGASSTKMTLECSLDVMRKWVEKVNDPNTPRFISFDSGQSYIYATKDAMYRYVSGVVKPVPEDALSYMMRYLTEREFVIDREVFNIKVSLPYAQFICNRKAICGCLKTTIDEMKLYIIKGVLGIGEEAAKELIKASDTTSS